MKVPPKRKGNAGVTKAEVARRFALNESPSEKEGKCQLEIQHRQAIAGPSMKVPPKRKGNRRIGSEKISGSYSLNESPSEKEGKSRGWGEGIHNYPSMKVPPKRKGNSQSVR